MTFHHILVSYGMHPVVCSSLKEYLGQSAQHLSSENKQDRHYRVNVCFILLLTTSLHVSVLAWAILRHT
jgi:hypothetical protein